MKGNMPKNSTGTLPTIPWHSDKTADFLAEYKPEHDTNIAYQPPFEANSLDYGFYYFYCSCGVVGIALMLKTHAVSEADLHLEAVAP